MIGLKDKVIVTDVDGVLLDWNFGFERWMVKNGHIAHFPENYDQGSGHEMNKKEELKYSTVFCKSPLAMGNLTPYKDAIHFVRKLHQEYGFVFHAVTAVNHDIYNARWDNLNRVFGKGIFIQLDCVGAFKHKGSVLEYYKNSGCFWLEDDVNNARTGLDLGLTPIVFNHSYNQQKDRSKLNKFVDNWSQAYQHITSPL